MENAGDVAGGRGRGGGGAAGQSGGAVPGAGRLAEPSPLLGVRVLVVCCPL